METNGVSIVDSRRRVRYSVSRTISITTPFSIWSEEVNRLSESYNNLWYRCQYDPSGPRTPVPVVAYEDDFRSDERWKLKVWVSPRTPEQNLAEGVTNPASSVHSSPRPQTANSAVSHTPSEAGSRWKAPSPPPDSPILSAERSYVPTEFREDVASLEVSPRGSPRSVAEPLAHSQLLCLQMTFSSDLGINGSVSMKLSDLSGTVIYIHDTIMLGDSNEATTFFNLTSEQATRTLRLTIQVEHDDDSHPQLGYTSPHIYNPVPMMDFFNRTLGGEYGQDVKFVLYRRVPRGDAMRSDRGCVYADRRVLGRQCAYFKRLFQDTDISDDSESYPERSSTLSDGQEARYLSLGDLDSEDDRLSDSDFGDDEDDDAASASVESPSVPSRPGIMTFSIGSSCAYKTWKAMIFYLYTGSISFAPLRSSAAGDSQNRVRDHERPEPVSCKSMYRLAKKLEIPQLEDLALRYLRSQLTIANIGKELFSKFTLRYDEVQELEKKFFVSNWSAIKTSSHFEDLLRSIFSGSHEDPTAVKIFREFLQATIVHG